VSRGSGILPLFVQTTATHGVSVLQTATMYDYHVPAIAFTFKIGAVVFVYAVELQHG
jgi:6-phosphogluconate dehydrogenase (decarboxylating)